MSSKMLKFVATDKAMPSKRKADARVADFDEIYDALLVKPAVRIGAILWQRGDRDTIDGFGPDGMSGLVLRISGFCSRIQSGFVFHYAFAMLIGVVVLVSWYYLRLKGM